MDKLNQLVKFGQANCLLRFGQSSDHRGFFKAVIENFPQDVVDIFQQNGSGTESLENEIIDFLFEGVHGVVDELKESFHNDKVEDNLIRYGFPANVRVSFIVSQGIVTPKIDFNSYDHIPAEDFVEIGKTAVWRELLGVDRDKHLRKCVSCERLFITGHGKRESCSAACGRKANYRKTKEKPGDDLRRRLKNQKDYRKRVRPKGWREYLKAKWEKKGHPEDMIESILRSKRGRPKKPKTP